MADNTITYELKDMNDWVGLSVDLCIVDPPFGIDFTGKATNYNRDTSNVVDGYIEWEKDQYKEKINELLHVIHSNLNDDGQALIFSGKDNSHIIHKECIKSNLKLEGKLYWSYNFAPYCSRRPAHNIYEIFWVVKSQNWYYNNECNYPHCRDGEANLSLLDIPRDYHKDIPKYPTRLPKQVIGVLLHHFSKEGDVIFDPLAGSGMVGCVSKMKNRNAILGDLNEEGLEVFESIKDIMNL